MDTLEKIEGAILEVQKNPKYRKNRKGLLKFLQARLFQVIYT